MNGTMDPTRFLLPWTRVVNIERSDSTSSLLLATSAALCSRSAIVGKWAFKPCQHQFRWPALQTAVHAGSERRKTFTDVDAIYTTLVQKMLLHSYGKSLPFKKVQWAPAALTHWMQVVICSGRSEYYTLADVQTGNRRAA
jgi:hypothetical protein